MNIDLDKNWRDLKFTDGNGEFQLIHKMGNLFTVKILKEFDIDKTTIVEQKNKITKDEFILAQHVIERLLTNGVIILI